VSDPERQVKVTASGISVCSFKKVIPHEFANLRELGGTLALSAGALGDVGCVRIPRDGGKVFTIVESEVGGWRLFDWRPRNLRSFVLRRAQSMPNERISMSVESP
jgi:hypothetical protein